MNLPLIRRLSVVASALVAVACAAEAPTTAYGPLDGRDLPPVDTGRVAVGDVAPDFILPTWAHGTVRLSDYRGSQDVVLVFYRGHW